MFGMMPIVQQAARRAASARLEAVIRELATPAEPREASRAQVRNREGLLLGDLRDPVVAARRLERILNGNDLTDIAYLARGMGAARAVCRILIRRDGRLVGYGTGFLVAPGVLMTNHHVFPDASEVRESVAEFGFERSASGVDLAPETFQFRMSPTPIIYEPLDMALVSVAPVAEGGGALHDWGWLVLNGTPGKSFVGEYLTIIQHPRGERKQICVRENKLLKYADHAPFLWYQTDTVGGSSGAPVFNNDWDVVALHHSAVPRTKRVAGRDVWLNKDGKPWKASQGDDAVDWIANEGVRISRIVDYLSQVHRGHPLAEAVLTARPSQQEVTVAAGGRKRGGVVVRSDGGGITRMLVPVEISVRVGGESEATPDLPGEGRDVGSLPNGAADVAAPVQLEKVEIDQTNYSERNGYNPKFLGAAFPVPLPKVASTRFGKAATVKGGGTVLKYWNYSAVMNRSRKMAFFSAANVNAGKFRSVASNEDCWVKDTRLDEDLQVGREWYKSQRDFEADRSMNPFDQGHLTRRSDLQWGDDDDEAKRNNDESYHYTNCTPQHWQFNQNKKVSGIWWRLEVAAIGQLSANAKKICLINGPIFDAPLCREGPDGELQLRPTGKPEKDGTFGEVQVPKQFFKVIAYVKDGELRARAFVVTQEELLATIDRYYSAEAAEKLTEREIHLYQVPIATVERLTALDFGSLSEADAVVEEAGFAEGFELRAVEEVRW